MAFDTSDVIIKKEKDELVSHIEIELCLTGPTSNDVIKHEYLEVTEDIVQSMIPIKREPDLTQYNGSSYCDGMQLKQESCDMSNINIKPTSSICNDVLNNINIKHINNIETVREHFKGECDYCNRIYGCRQSLVKHIDKHVAQQTCKGCNVTFRTNTEFIDHVKSCHNSKTRQIKANLNGPYACSECDKSFTARSSLKHHQRAHTNERPFVCNVCNRRFTQSGHLRHHQQTHSKQPSHLCNVCDKRFTQSGSLKRHILTHTKEHPHVCDVCERRFSQSCHLKRHQMTHINARPYVCDVCNKCFSQSVNLMSHHLTHTFQRTFTCDVCNKRFARIAGLKRHKLVHTNGFPYVCNVCNKSFKMNGYLSAHLKTHTNERPYFCKLCDRSYTSSGNLRTHQRKHAHNDGT